ncbi:MAG: PadR family transcriptional regulator [Anaerolineales bacterium]|nr:PadR family transcriptional regulator [Anaerolineales bacterium]
MSVTDTSLDAVSEQEALINPSDNTQNFIPLREPTFFILLSLASGPRHGYVIMKDIAYMSDERVTLSTSTMYTALKRLLEQEWIRREDDLAERDNNRERKVYSLTDLGRRVLEAEVERLDHLVITARRRAIGKSI